jgi:hypothetical protein
MITVVTAYVPIPGHPRSEQTYHALGRELLNLDIPLMYLKGALEHCWLYRYLRWRKQDFTHSTSDNPEKNSVAYHIVQAQKSDWLMDAAFNVPNTEVLVWIDYGIFHVPGVTGRIIKDFLDRAADEQAIAIPGCWERDYVYDDRHPCWRFSGGVMVVPQRHVIAFDQAMKREYVRWLDSTNNLSWEVNTLARVERRETGLPIWWYRAADHDASMFTAYQPTEIHSKYVH